MARPKELLSLLQIAEETGISYQTLRGYALKHGDVIPSEGWGRSTRYPRAAIKVFERLRRESRPGRKPGQSAVREEAPASKPEPRPAAEPRQQVLDTSGLERELAGIRMHLGSIAESLGLVAAAAQSLAARPPSTAVAPAVPVESPATPAMPEKPAIPEAARGLRETEEPGGHRRLHSLSHVRGQRGRRPE
jgi:hypothetical protein